MVGGDLHPVPRTMLGGDAVLLVLCCLDPWAGGRAGCCVEVDDVVASSMAAWAGLDVVRWAATVDVDDEEELCTRGRREQLLSGVTRGERETR